MQLFITCTKVIALNETSRWTNRSTEAQTGSFYVSKKKQVKGGVLYSVNNFITMLFAGIQYRGKHHVELTYDPMHFNAIACSNDHIFVAEATPGGGIHVHTWSGRHTQWLSHSQLGLRDDDWIWAIKYVFADRSLQLAVGDYDLETVHSLHAYRVSGIQNEASFSNRMIPDYRVPVCFENR